MSHRMRVVAKSFAETKRPPTRQTTPKSAKFSPCNVMDVAICSGAPIGSTEKIRTRERSYSTKRGSP
eukprot:scaffold252059_cov28-Tisochrysis_lutea.AAC.2